MAQLSLQHIQKIYDNQVHVVKVCRPVGLR